jgi:hypothetical protein
MAEVELEDCACPHCGAMAGACADYPNCPNGPAALCMQCRSTFTEEQIAGANECPACGNKGLPADPRKTATLKLTHAEWRVLFIWADQWARHIVEDDRPGYDSPGTIAALVAEAKRQAPDLPALTLFGDVRELADALGTKVEMVSKGERLIFNPPPGRPGGACIKDPLAVCDGRFECCDVHPKDGSQ